MSPATSHYSEGNAVVPHLKRDIRFLGVDDGPFRRSDKTVRVVGVVTRGSAYVEGVLSGEVGVDGDDATKAILRMVSRSKFRPLLRCVFFNGVAVGGFNVLDLDALHETLEIPVATISRDPPDPQGIRRALQVAFDDWEPRWRRVERYRPRRLRSGGFQVYVSARGATGPEVARFLAASTVRGAFPECLRLAHVIASGISRGESGGQA